MARDGRVWDLRLVRYRLPRQLVPAPGDKDADLEADPLALVRFARPAWYAILGCRPWIPASAEDPPVTMVWRATGSRSATTALDEIADALERGDPRPQPFWAHWTGYDRGGLRLARKA
ncbi:MAG TPA: hypothetical protein VE753_09290 [Gaiellaceae bacterium]|jgi:hypothetical protein|nr:hypothetical protein [Gaiellaceae bacterium]